MLDLSVPGAAELFEAGLSGRTVEAGLTVSIEFRDADGLRGVQVERFLPESAASADALLSDCLLPVRPPEGRAALPGADVCTVAARFHFSGAAYW